MRLAAAKLGIGVPEGACGGRVHSVFRGACILALDDGGLLTLVLHQAGGLPGGITLAKSAEVNFSSTASAGASVSVRGGILRIAGSEISVDLRSAIRWRSGLADLALDAANDGTQSAWRVAASLLLADGRARAFVRIAGTSLPALAVSLARRDVAAATTAMRPLVGLGAGGTPAGDDFLVGILAALRASAGGDPRRADFAAAMGQAVRLFAARTNDVSRVYLEAAGAGEVSERLADLVAVLARGSSADIVSIKAAAAISVGHTSGADATLGLLLGIAALGPTSFAAAGQELADRLSA
jgi:hypothetical protein